MPVLFATTIVAGTFAIAPHWALGAELLQARSDAETAATTLDASARRGRPWNKRASG
jgi:hypothetical protein